MKTIIEYECEYCHRRSGRRKDILNCELSHLGLTEKEASEWRSLYETFNNACRRENNGYSDGTTEKACIALEQFEQKHNLEGKQLPVW